LDELDFMVEQCNNLYVNNVTVITGDMNSLDIVNLSTDHGLTQIIDQPTHGNHILDKFLTNRPDLFTFTLLRPTSTIKTKHKTILVNCDIDTGKKHSNPTNTVKRINNKLITRHLFLL
jgi:hypothetical protein